MEKNELIEKWLKNELTPDEQVAFDALEDAPFFNEIIEEGQRFNAKKHAQVTSFETLENRLSAKNNTNWKKIIPRIAAALIIGFSLFYFVNNPSIKEFDTQYSESKTITLPDHSVVQLNELSKLEYQSKNWEENRNLDLKGEAFFDVEKGSRFDVNTSYGTVSVLGTEFNVVSRDGLFRVSCYEGLVEVRYNEKTVKLPAGSEFVLTNTSEEKRNIVIATPQWLHNQSIFERVLLKDVITELEKQYKVTVISNIQNKEIYFTGAFTHTNLESAIKAITHPFNLTYNIKNKTEIIISDDPN
ncbi:FecR family protein [Tenacibaculum sp. 190130A14a]|uniref:Transmembrane sensor n=1 Tax=Tenacibaculum polynesiense TaxID=3137857 RepID=A0ABP1EXQ8_9FLAO